MKLNRLGAGHSLQTAVHYQRENHLIGRILLGSLLCFFFINPTIRFIEENNASNATAALMACLAPKAKVLRDGKWSEEDAAVLVPGAVVSIKLGDIIPADARLLEGEPLKID